MNTDQYFLKWYSKESLERRFYERVRFKCSPGLDRIGISTFLNQFQENIEIIQKKILNETYNFTKYSEVLISKGRNKVPRVISLPTIRDKVALSSLHGYLQETYKDELDNRLIHTKINNIIEAMPKYNFFIKIDIKRFYQNIDHELLLSYLDEKICSAAHYLIKKAITTPTVPRDYNHQTNTINTPDKGVPEGLSISSVLADIYLQPFDTFFKQVEDIFYCRYVDDILILCSKENFEMQLDHVNKRLINLKLETHSIDDKQKMSTSTIESGFSYLGYHFSLENISVKSSTKNQFEHSIEKMFSDYLNEKKEKRNDDEFIWRLNIKISGCIHDSKKFGWMFFYSQITDLKLLKHLDWLLAHLFQRYNIPYPNGQIKSFVKTFYEIKYNLNNSDYFLNVDRISITEMGDIIHSVFHYLVPIKEEDVRELFFNILKKSLKDLEKDIQFFS